MQNDTDELKQTIFKLNQRVRNLELFALATLVGVGVYVARSATSWFMINKDQALFFGVAFSIFLMLLVWRHHVSTLLQRMGLHKTTANILVGGVAVLGIAYMLPSLITVLR